MKDVRQRGKMWKDEYMRSDGRRYKRKTCEQGQRMERKKKAIAIYILSVGRCEMV